jgi:23S rRNA pseudouridine1911/1915/1917 synthase
LASDLRLCHGAAVTHAADHQLNVPQSLDAARLDVVLARELGWSRGQAQHAIADGRVYLDGRRERVAGVRTRAGQQVSVMPPAPERHHIGGGSLRVVCETADLLVVDKPAGLPSQQPPRGGDALDRRVLAAFPGAGHVHRLDRDVSGLVVFGRHPAATAHLAAQFRAHTARRHYLALVRTALAPQGQQIDEAVAELRPGHMVVSPTGVPASSRVVPLGFDAAAQLGLVRVELATGRTHQVRVHLAWALGPIAGDVLYGDLAEHASGRIALHAAVLELSAPSTGEQVRIELPPPDDFWQAARTTPWPLPADWQGLAS